MATPAFILPYPQRGACGKGTSDAMFYELMAVDGLASEPNRLVKGYRIAVDAVQAKE